MSNQKQIDRLPVPIVLLPDEIGDSADRTNIKKIYSGINLRKPSGRIISQIREDYDKSNEFIALRNFVAGCTESIVSSRDGDIETDPLKIKGLYNSANNKTIEYIAIKLMVEFYDGDDFVEGIYPCPRCGFKILAENTIMEDGLEIDTRDRISDLGIGYMDDPESEYIFEIQFTEPVLLKSNNGEDVAVNAVFRMPTIQDYVVALSQVGSRNSITLQFAVYAQALLKVNGVDVDKSWKRSFGLQLFNNMTEIKKDVGQISGHINKYGINPLISRFCPECGKIWEATIKTANFFDSALQ